MSKKIDVSENLREYVDGLIEGCTKPQSKFVRDLVYGMIASQSIMLSDTARVLDERTKLLYTEKRLSRNLNSDRLSDENLRKNYLSQMKRWTKGAVIAVDMTDITKPYGQSQEYLAKVRDESKKGFGNGYWAVFINALRPDGKHLPLWLHVYSSIAPDFTSQNREITKAIDFVRPYVSKDSIWVMDRGFDSEFFFSLMDQHNCTWVIRQTAHRKIIYRGKSIKLVEHAKGLASPHTASLVFWQKGKRRARTIRFGSAIVTLKTSPKQRQVIVARRISGHPLVFLTNDTNGSPDNVLRLIKAYIGRWSCEEATRLIKQVFKLENVRALKYRGVKRLALFAHISFGFLARWHLKATRIVVGAILKAVQFFGDVPKFPYYRIAAAITFFLKRDGPLRYKLLI